MQAAHTYYKIDKDYEYFDWSQSYNSSDPSADFYPLAYVQFINEKKT
eukprot:CAMPEP_0202966788 /NCGR_PEP_ID=MMETSP1396-20130829/11350_1 /ASSEMBLY_ACC=CAM_ASM_000872 /TAXON_ID= /ORGANISM="Pseudokeronopsis sp., Strain Brazil" /LENGTH=46 /DNA_ID= /DNA_START= /DNA_END= /DNA_ORIENTATION=